MNKKQAATILAETRWSYGPTLIRGQETPTLLTSDRRVDRAHLEAVGISFHDGPNRVTPILRGNETISTLVSGERNLRILADAGVPFEKAAHYQSGSTPANSSPATNTAEGVMHALNAMHDQLDMKTITGAIAASLPNREARELTLLLTDRVFIPLEERKQVTQHAMAAKMGDATPAIHAIYSAADHPTLPQRIETLYAAERIATLKQNLTQLLGTLQEYFDDIDRETTNGAASAQETATLTEQYDTLSAAYTPLERVNRLLDVEALTLNKNGPANGITELREAAQRYQAGLASQQKRER